VNANVVPYDFGQARDKIEQAKRAMQASEQATRDAYAGYARAERAYRMALATRILELHADGIAWTVTADIARGDKKVADLRYHRDVAEGVKEAAQSATWRLTADRKDLAALIDWSKRVSPDGQYDEPRAA
jgi:hypothetical protein